MTASTSNQYNKYIKEYYQGIERIQSQEHLFGEKDTERVFINLLDNISTKKNNYYVRLDYRFTDFGYNIKPDCTVFSMIGIPYGMHEAKKYDVDLDAEIKDKVSKGYPLSNIIFEDSQRAVLYQYGEKKLDIALSNKKEFTQLLATFFNYESKEIQDFNKSLEEFQENIPKLVEQIRNFFDNASKNSQYIKHISQFLELCRECINPYFERLDVREIIVQHNF